MEASQKSKLEKLKEAESLNDFAEIIHYKPKGFSYVLYKRKQYHSFEIPKKGGGLRCIQAPEKELKKLQVHLKNLLYECYNDLKKT